MNIPVWEAQIWESILDEAQERGDEEAIELAMKHLYPAYPNIEDTALLSDDEDLGEDNPIIR
jgi:hypothetical protein